MSPVASNYDTAATIDDGSCTYEIRGCTDSAALNYVAAATMHTMDCIPRVHGCTAPAASPKFLGKIDNLTNVLGILP